MKPGPSSVRLFSKCAQSTMSRASSATSCSSRAGFLRQGPTAVRDRAKRVKFSLAAARLVERIGAAAEVEPQRDRAQIQVAAHRIEQIAAVTLRKLFEAIAEHDEARWTGVHLGDVAELDALTLGRGRRVGLDRSLEPAVELTRGNAPAPRVAK